jgi:membrane-bound metal-dependent hydrolase YbcI (DUF457 family)
MSSMLGHILGAQAVLGAASPLAPRSTRTHRAAWIVGIIAVLPELEALVYMLAGRPAWLQPQRDFTHSLLFAVVMGLIATLFLLKGIEHPDWQLGMSTAGVMVLVALAHPVMEMFSKTWTYASVTSVQGVPLFWPFSGGLVRGFARLLPDAYYSTESFREFFARSFGYWRSMIAMVLEALILVPLVVMGWKRPLPAAAFWALGGVSAIGMLLCYLLYQAAGRL